ncbi:MAG TPA: MBL fold hydrolase, partial [Clostridiales bacterium]|nr:MBL fold hydrolase [Clostridiales bacterium]
MIHIGKNIAWTGKKDPGLKSFHGNELSTHRGTSYNSYLIRDRKTVLIDTVWTPYADEFVDQLEKEVGIANLDCLIVNHCETDHGGSIARLLERKPDIPIYCSKNGADMIRRHFHKDWDFHIVKTGDTLDIGEETLVFVEMQMLHWPDSMLTFAKQAGIVFSNDAFGQHYSPDGLYNDEADVTSLYEEAIKYYANILSPFSPLVLKKIQQISAMGLDIRMIAPSHGVIWRENPGQIIEAYARWADHYAEDHILILYGTIWGATQTMAQAISEGILKTGIPCRLINAAYTDRNDLVTEVFKARGLIIGSSTLNNHLTAGISAILDEMKSLRIKGKKAAAFGSYGWSGESGKLISSRLEETGNPVMIDPLMINYRPTT